MQLSTAQEQRLQGAAGQAAAMALRIVLDSARLLGTQRLVPITSAHIDGCLYHGDSGTEFAERLVADGGQVQVPTTLNVGALDLMRPANVLLHDNRRAMAERLMRAYQALGCQATFTCAPYQAGHRPALGEQVAWGESNAVAFCNSVLGARTNRYGDFLDIACAISGCAPEYGLHLSENRVATVHIQTGQLPARLRNEDVFWPVLGAWMGRKVGDAVPVISGLEGFATEDRLKALGAAAASFGAVALFHVEGVTPEATTLEAASQGEIHGKIQGEIQGNAQSGPLGRANHQRALEVLVFGPDEVTEALAWLSTAVDDTVSAIGIGSPHLSLTEFGQLLSLLDGRRSVLPFYANTGRHVVAQLEQCGWLKAVEAAGITLIVDTCIAVTPIIRQSSGVLMTNSGKFAHYAPGNIGLQVVYGSLSDCVESAVAGKLVRDLSLWQLEA